MAPPFPFPLPEVRVIKWRLDGRGGQYIDYQYELTLGIIEMTNGYENDWIWGLNGLRLLVEGKGLGIGVVGHGGGEGYVTIRRRGACYLVDDSAMLVHYGVGRGNNVAGICASWHI